MVLNSLRASNTCRVSWHPNVVSFLLATSFTFSILSTLDCQFIRVNLSVTSNTSHLVLPVVNSSNLEVGLWTLVNPITDASNDALSGRCVVYADASKVGGGVALEVDGKEYGNPYGGGISNGDTFWTASRVSAICGAIFGLIACVTSYLINFNVISLKGRGKMALLPTLVLAFIGEVLKIVLFLHINLCMAQMWPTNEVVSNNHENESYSKAISCGLHRGAAASILAAAFYFVAFALTAGYLLRPIREEFKLVQLPRPIREEFNLVQERTHRDDATKSTFSKLYAGDEIEEKKKAIEEMNKQNDPPKQWKPVTNYAKELK